MLTKHNNLMFTSVLIVLMIANVLVIGIGSSDTVGPSETDQPIFESITTTVWIDPGEDFYIYFDMDGLELEAKRPENLPDECDQALALVPEWLRGNLSYKFRRLTSDFQTTYANLILDSPDEKYIDEIAFSIAHSAVENLQDDYFFPELLTHNAQLIYDADQYLKYVEVVEREDYTTVIYKDRDNVSMEMPKDIYYWYIVLPKLSDELPTYVNPDYNFMQDPPFDPNYGVAPPTGKFWRDWLFYNNDSGYPLLKEYLGDSYTVWEAISACNSWMSGSMSFTSDNERPIQPVRIYRKHIGRCGEYQDMRNAIARAGLIPSTCACNIAEDHVWNEFWDQRWIHWDGTVDNPMMYENGWGKKISSVWNTRGDSDIWSVTEKYTQTCSYTATVLDDSGLPVDGALVRVLTEHYYYPEDLLSTTTWGTTDYTGTVTIPLGDERNFWSSAESETLGNDPLNGVTQVISNSEAGVDYTHTFNLPMSGPVLKGNQIPPPDVEDERFKMEVDYDVVANIVSVKNVLTEDLLGKEEHGDLYGPSGNIDFFLADAVNYNLFNSDLAFDAYNISERSTSGGTSFVIPDEDRYYAVLSNGFSQKSTKIVNITVNIISGVEVEITGPDNNSEFDQGEVVFITGTSWGPLGVSKVEIAIDDSGNWSLAEDTSGFEDPYSIWQFNLDTIALKPDMHTIRAKASYNENSSFASINISLKDATDPMLAIESPAQDSTCWLYETLTVNGTATDNGWIDFMELIIDSDEINSTDITSFLVDDFWSYEINTYDLGYGEHTLTVRATDTASNFASITRNIWVLEAVEPKVRIDSPSSDLVFKRGDTLDISGVATDNNEIISLELIIDDKIPIDIISELEEDGSWSYDWNTQSTSSANGKTIIKVRATDFSGNVDSDENTVILDGSAPKTTISVPEDYQTFRAGDFISITGTASDDWGLDKVELVFDNIITVDITNKVANDNWYYDNWDTFDLDSGAHTISVTAIDSVGYKSEASVTIIIDTQEPELEITRMDEPQAIGDLIVLNGKVYDDLEIKELALIIDSNEPIDITSSLANDIWEYHLDTSGMSEGRHTIRIIATDSVDNQVSDSIRIEFIQGTTSPGTSPDSTSGLFDDGEVVMFIFIGIIIILGMLVLVVIYVSARKGK